MNSKKIKQLIETTIKEIFAEISENDESDLVPDKRGKYHQAQGKDERFWGDRGAGILLISRDSGKILLVLRSSLVNEPGTWGMPGGKIDSPEESPMSAAKREAEEELGYKGPIEMKPAHVFKAGSFQFFNFIGIVPNDFEPTLDWENDDFGWYELSNLPSPLHFGVVSLLKNSKSDIEDLIVSKQS